MFVTAEDVLKTFLSKLKDRGDVAMYHVACDGERAAEVSVKWAEDQKMKHYYVWVKK